MKKFLPALFTLLILSACSLNFPWTASDNQAGRGPAMPATPTSVPVKVIPATPNTDGSVQFGDIKVSQDDLPSYKIFLIAMEDKGLNGTEVGCGDSAIAVDGKIGKPIEKPEDRIKAALTELFSIKTRDYGESGYVNILADSKLSVDSVTMDGGKATVKLSGTLSMAGECDDPRVEAQISQTVLQFPEVASADIFLNNKPLQDYVSLKG